MTSPRRPSLLPLQRAWIAVDPGFGDVQISSASFTIREKGTLNSGIMLRLNPLQCILEDTTQLCRPLGRRFMSRSGGN